MSGTEPEAADQYSDTNNRDIEAKQKESVSSSEAVKQDSAVDADAVKVLPGTGGPDDVGDIEVAPEDYDRTGHAGS
jgi:hypothetical protein